MIGLGRLRNFLKGSHKYTKTLMSAESGGHIERPEEEKPTVSRESNRFYRRGFFHFSILLSFLEQIYQI